MPHGQLRREHFRVGFWVRAGDLEEIEWVEPSPLSRVVTRPNGSRTTTCWPSAAIPRRDLVVFPLDIGDDDRTGIGQESRDDEADPFPPPVGATVMRWPSPE